MVRTSVSFHWMTRVVMQLPVVVVVVPLSMISLTTPFTLLVVSSLQG